MHAMFLKRATEPIVIDDTDPNTWKKDHYLRYRAGLSNGLVGAGVGALGGAGLNYLLGNSPMNGALYGGLTGGMIGGIPSYATGSSADDIYKMIREFSIRNNDKTSAERPEIPTVDRRYRENNALHSGIIGALLGGAGGAGVNYLVGNDPVNGALYGALGGGVLGAVPGYGGGLAADAVDRELQKAQVAIDEENKPAAQS